MTSTATDEERQRAVAKLIADPVACSRQLFRIDTWEKQDEILRAVALNRRVTIQACHSSSKTKTLAMLALWWMIRWPRSVRVITTGPTGRQVRFNIWAEIRKIAEQSHIPFPESKTTHLELPSDIEALGFSTQSTSESGGRAAGVSAQGWHADYVLILIDEALGVSQEIYDAMHGIMMGGSVRVVETYNPTIPMGAAYRHATETDSGWHRIKIDGLRTPNLRRFNEDLLGVLPDEEMEALTIDRLRQASDADLDADPRPYLVTARGILESVKELGGPGDPRWESRVRGRFPQQSKYAVFANQDIENAMVAYQPIAAPVIIGIDVAGPGEDETVAVANQRGGIVELQAWGLADPFDQCAIFCRRMHDRYGVDCVNVDADGMGWHFYLRLSQTLASAGIRVNPLQSGSKPLPGQAEAQHEFANLKAQMHWRARAILQDGQVRGLTDEKLRIQLSSITFQEGKHGIEITPKKKLPTSPDRAEAWIYSQFVFRDALADRQRPRNGVPYQRQRMARGRPLV